LAPAGFQVVVERGAGAAASFPDEAYAEAGADLSNSPWEADGVVKVRKPSAEEAGRLRDGQLLVGFLEPLTDRAGIERLAERGVHAFAMESIPRITRAQPMDALSSQATVSGYKAVLLAAERLPRFFPMLMTAAGTVAPAKVLVLGAGFRERLVGERCGGARARLDDHLKTGGRQPRNRVGNECHSALAWLELARDADAHGALLFT